MLVFNPKRFDCMSQVLNQFNVFDGAIELRFDICIIPVGDRHVEIILK